MGYILIIILVFTGTDLWAQGKSFDVIDLTEISLEDDGEPEVEEVEVSEGDSLKVEEILEPSGDYNYASFGREDPFQEPSGGGTFSMNSSMQKKDVTGLSIPIVSPLQAFPLDQLKLKGVWKQSTGESRAVIMTPNKEGVIVKIGDPVSAGKVMNIERGVVKVRQYSINGAGIREFKDIELKSGKPKPITTREIQLNPGQMAQFAGENKGGLAEQPADALNKANPDIANPPLGQELINEIPKPNAVPKAAPVVNNK